MSKLYKNKKNGMIFGVCSGIAEYTGLDVSVVRLLTVGGTVLSGSIIFWVYLLLAIVLPNKD
jgi:phage shock protein C